MRSVSVYARWRSRSVCSLACGINQIFRERYLPLEPSVLALACIADGQVISWTQAVPPLSSRSMMPSNVSHVLANFDQHGLYPRCLEIAYETCFILSGYVSCCPLLLSAADPASAERMIYPEGTAQCEIAE